MTKKLLDNMKFQWPRTPAEVKEISFQQVEWLLQGLEIYNGSVVKTKI